MWNFFIWCSTPHLHTVWTGPKGPNFPSSKVFQPSLACFYALPHPRGAKYTKTWKLSKLTLIFPHHCHVLYHSVTHTASGLCSLLVISGLLVLSRVDFTTTKAEGQSCSGLLVLPPVVPLVMTLQFQHLLDDKYYYT